MDFFSKKLRELRMQNREQQADIAMVLGVSPQSYSAYENGREPNYNTLIKLAIYFDCTTDYLLGISDTRNYSPDKKDMEINFLRAKLELIEELLSKSESKLRGTLTDFNKIANVSKAIRKLDQDDYALHVQPPADPYEE